MSIKIKECKRDNLCYECDNKKCWHAGQLIADCTLYKCNREGNGYEDCESCDLLKQIIKEKRRYS